MSGLLQYYLSPGMKVVSDKKGRNPAEALVQIGEFPRLRGFCPIGLALSVNRGGKGRSQISTVFAMTVFSHNL